MAIRPVDRYPGKTAGANSDYPHGEARNVTTPSDGTGTPLEAGWVNDWFGFQAAALDAGGITPSGSPDDVGVCQVLDGVKAAALQADYVDPAGAPAISVSGYLDRQGFWAATRQDIQDANDYILSQLRRAVIRIVPDSVITATSTIQIDADYVSVEGNRAVISAIASVATPALRVVTSQAAGPIEAPGAFIRNLSILGPGISSGVVGIDALDPSGTAVLARLLLQNLNVRSFLTGVRVGGGADFALSMVDCGIANCTTGLSIEGSGGRGLRAAGGKISACLVGVGAARNALLTGVEFDSNDQIIVQTSGVVDMFGCPMSADDYATTPIVITGAGSRLNVIGGGLRLTDAPPATMGHWVSVGAGSSFSGRNVAVENSRTATGEFATGAGFVEMHGVPLGDPADECPVLHATESALIDGGFEDGTGDPIDDIFIIRAGDLVSIDDRFDVSGLSVTVSADQANSGSNSLRLLKGSDPTAIIPSGVVVACFPVRRGDRVGGRLFYRKPGSAVGSFSFRFGFVTRETGGYEGGGTSLAIVPRIRARGTDQVVTVTPGSSDTGWVELLIPNGSTPLIAPAWATHFIVEVDLDDWQGSTNGYLYLDDINLNIIG